MNTSTKLLSLVLALVCGIAYGADKTNVDWDAEYEKLLESDPGVREKIDVGAATKQEVIQWLKSKRSVAKSQGKSPNSKGSKKGDLSAFRKKLGELVESGKLSKDQAAKLWKTMAGSDKGAAKPNSKKIDWDAAYEELLKKNSEVKAKVDSGGATKEDIIAWMKSKRKSGGRKKGGVKPGARPGSINFYAIVIGRLKSKDVELGEMVMDVDYVISGQTRVNEELIGSRVKLVGISGQFLDSLLQIKRGETLKVRTGDFNPKTKQLGFGYKFQVLERTAPFNPADFGVPPDEVRGFQGELIGKIVEATGYEVLLDVQAMTPADESKAKDAKSIVGSRIRIGGFYNQHADAFANLHQGDKIRVSVDHRNASSDALNVTKLLQKVK